MSLADLKSQLPGYAKDLRLNLGSVLSEGGAPGLTQKQIMVVALAAAIASRYKPLTKAVAEEAAQHASAEELNGARVAASIMGMNNIYYRFVHMVSEPEYGTLRAALRMNAMANPGGAKIDFELASLAVSAGNGCGMCVDSHEKTLRKHGLSSLPIQSAIRIAAVIHAVAVALEQGDVAG